MLKKLLAGLTAVALSLGMVALTAGPASAHHSDVSAAFACSTPTTGTITWSVHNWNGGKSGRVWSSTDDIVPEGTLFDSDETKTFSQAVSATGSYSLSVTMRWYDGSGDPADLSNWNTETTNSGWFQVKSSDFDSCKPDDTGTTIDICHSGRFGYQLQTVTYAQILFGNDAHKNDSQDIIPSFSYTFHGQPGTYGGKNLSKSWLLGLGCDNKVTPAKPAFEDAQCSADIPGAVNPNGRYFIPAGNGKVEYRVAITNSSNNPSNGSYGPAVDQAGGWFDAPVGKWVHIKAFPLGYYEIQGYDHWEEKIDAVSSHRCDWDADKPVKPSYTDAVCTAAGQSGGTVTIPSGVDGIQYAYRYGTSGGWTDVDQGTVLTGVPEGTTVQVRATVLDGYDYDGYWGQGWIKWYNNDDSRYVQFEIDGDRAHKCLVPTDPTPNQPVCSPNTPGVVGQGGYTLPSPIPTGVTYTVKVNDGAPFTGTAGFHPLNIGDVVTITASALSPYKLVPGSMASWGPWTISHPTDPNADCIYPAPAQPVVAHAQTCEVDELLNGEYVTGWISIPTTTPLIQYSIDGVPYGPGDHDFGPGIYEITAEVNTAGYYLTDYDGPYDVEVEKAKPCGDLTTEGGVTPTVTFVQTTCKATGTYTLGAEPIENAAGIAWTVTGGLPTTLGTHAVSTAGTVTITAAQAGPDYGFPGDDDGYMEWSYDFSAVPDDCLPTLALTGSSVATGGLGLAGLLTLGGILMVVAHRRRAALIEG